MRLNLDQSIPHFFSERYRCDKCHMTFYTKTEKREHIDKEHRI